MAWNSIKSFVQGVDIAVQALFVVKSTADSLAVLFRKDRPEFQRNGQLRESESIAELEKVRLNYSREMEEYRQYSEDIRLQKRLDSEREQLARRSQHEQQLEQYRRETQMILAHAQLISTLAVADRQEIREKFWSCPPKFLAKIYSVFC